MHSHVPPSWHNKDKGMQEEEAKWKEKSYFLHSRVLEYLTH